MAQSSKNIPKGSSPLRNLQGQLIGYQTPSGKKVYFETSQGEAPIEPLKIGSGKLQPGFAQETSTVRTVTNNTTTETPKNAELTIEQKQEAANAARRAGQSANIPPEQGTPVDTTEPETPGAGDTTPAAAPPVPASEVVKPPSQRELLIKEARTKYKDSPFKQWAHANQKLAMALKPGQVGYAQVQEYLKERGKNGKLKVKPEEKPFIKSNATKIQMGAGANDLRGYAGSTSPIA